MISTYETAPLILDSLANRMDGRLPYGFRRLRIQVWSSFPQLTTAVWTDERLCDITTYQPLMVSNNCKLKLIFSVATLYKLQCHSIYFILVSIFMRKQSFCNALLLNCKNPTIYTYIKIQQNDLCVVDFSNKFTFILTRF